MVLIEIECTCPKCSHDFNMEYEIDETELIQRDMNDLD